MKNADDFTTLWGVRREVQRCQASLHANEVLAAAFWRRRLERLAKLHEAAAAVLRMQLAAMTRPTPTSDGPDTKETP